MPTLNLHCSSSKKRPSVLGGLAVFCMCVYLAGCSSTDDSVMADAPVEELYAKAMEEFKAGHYEKAAKAFEEVDRQHPYSKWAAKAQLMLAYVHYQHPKYDKALAAVDAFIQLHPGHTDAAYAFYLRALCYYEQIASVRRDQENTQLASSALEDVARRYPGTEYAKDARYKLDLVRDHSAGKEMAIGRYYIKKGAYVAAINRFRKVVDQYQTTMQAPEALHRLTEAYLALGLRHEAQASAAVLGHNYPGSNWYADSYYLLKGEDLRPEETKKDERSWLNRLLGKKLEG